MNKLTDLRLCFLATIQKSEEPFSADATEIRAMARELLELRQREHRFLATDNDEATLA